MPHYICRGSVPHSFLHNGCRAPAPICLSTLMGAEWVHNKCSLVCWCDLAVEQLRCRQALFSCALLLLLIVFRWAGLICCCTVMLSLSGSLSSLSRWTPCCRMSP